MTNRGREVIRGKLWTPKGKSNKVILCEHAVIIIIIIIFRVCVYVFIAACAALPANTTRVCFGVMFRRYGLECSLTSLP